MSRLNLAMVIDESHLDATTDIVMQARKVGLKVESINKDIGAIFGSGDETIVGALRGITGVEEVRQEQSFRQPEFSNTIPQ